MVTSSLKIFDWGADGGTENQLYWWGLSAEALGAQALLNKSALEGCDLHKRKTKTLLRCVTLGFLREKYESSICLNFKIACSYVCNSVYKTLTTTQRSFVKVFIHLFIQEKKPKDLGSVPSSFRHVAVRTT